MKKLLLFGMCLFCSSWLTGQSVTPVVIANAGGHGETATHSIDWTLGELAIETLSGATNSITQGFHQPEVISVNVVDKRPDIDLNIYPNPTSSFLVIGGASNYQLEGQFITVEGKVNNAFTISDELVDISNMPPGTYFLNILEGKKVIKTYKIEKTGF